MRREELPPVLVEGNEAVLSVLGPWAEVALAVLVLAVAAVFLGFLVFWWVYGLPYEFWISFVVVAFGSMYVAASVSVLVRGGGLDRVVVLAAAAMVTLWVISSRSSRKGWGRPMRDVVRGSGGDGDE